MGGKLSQPLITMLPCNGATETWTNNKAKRRSWAIAQSPKYATELNDDAVCQYVGVIVLFYLQVMQLIIVFGNFFKLYYKTIIPNLKLSTLLLQCIIREIDGKMAP